MSLLNVENLKTHFETERGFVTAVRGVSFTMDKGEIIGIVGESGCGKSVMSQSIIRLQEHSEPVEYEGAVIFEEKDLLQLPLKEMNKVRGNDISIIFQDPQSSLNPVYTIGNQIVEAIMLHQKLTKKEANARALDLLKLTGIPAAETRFHEYPHQLSGGMQQRAMIAMALACEPKLLIADEPTTALDVTIQAQILDLMVKLNKELDMGILFITHDLDVVAEICDKVKVMYLGEIIEEATTNQLFEEALHPYTQGLIQSKPTMEKDKSQPLTVIKGMVPSLTNVPKGCSFSTRCPFATELCRSEAPPTIQYNEDHTVKCWLYDGEKGGWNHE